MTNRVENLRKDQYLKDRFEEKGIHSLLTDIKFTAHIEDTWDELWKKYVLSVIKKFRSVDANLSNCEEVSFGPKKVTFEIIDDFGDYPNLLGLLGSIIKSNPEAVNEAHVIKVSYDTGQNLFEGFSLLHREIPEKYHNGRWRNIGKEYHRIFDIKRLLGECYAYNAFIRYTKANKEYMQHRIVKDIVEQSHRQQSTIMPKDESFAKDLLSLMKHFGYEQFRGPKVDCQIPACLFYLTEKENGDLETNFGDACINFRNIMIPMFIRDMAYLRDDAEHMSNSANEYSRAWQTKKNITQKIQQRMQDNEFLSMFATVELDNDVEVEKFSLLEKELGEMRKLTFLPVMKDHSFRIRKLGNYRALGVYFSAFKALVIDLDGPDSFFHEIGHMNDYTFRLDGRLLSESFDFLPVYEAYVEMVRRNVSQLVPGDHFLAQWFGKTKYNASYYLRNTEVFARSYEMYLFVVKGIRSSFLQETYESPVYPMEDAYLETVKRYFDQLLPVPEVKAEITPEHKVSLFDAIFNNDITAEQITFNM
ncbi:hypothetical protein [Paenibacillus sp. GP183]|uniref:hypothetical protein n=1 Tax=Paenibacillus sp. GP183 TaxID=1882751 RepID=UPI00089474F1|nr:hypothetical protein [Paenibacillus sp. GP183]SED13898.1 hypothetical protein SAMN05443246_5869 [Paenibacillus sp. GP183]